MSAPPPAADASDPTWPVFLVGAERSGTTLLRLMLDAHPELAWANEFEFAVDLVSDDGRWPTLADYAAFLATHRVFQAGPYSLDPSDPALPYPDLVRGFLEERRTAARKTFVGATVHRHFDRLLHLWPDARFLHLVRDPRDVAASCIPMGWAGNVWTGVSRWIAVETLWERLSGRLAPGRALEIRYEALIASPERELRRICDFLGLSYHPHMLRYPEWTSYEAPDPALSERWRAWPARDVQLVEGRVRDLLERRGYAPSGLPAHHPGTFERLALRAQDRIARIRFGLRVYGWRLRLAEFLANRLGLRRWRQRIQLRKNVIDRSRLR